MQRVGRRATNNSRPEILQNHDLSFSVSSGHGDDTRTNFFRAVMQPQTAGEQSVAEGIMNNIVLCYTRGNKTTRDKIRPGFNIAFGITENSRTAAGAGRSMQANDTR